LATAVTVEVARVKVVMLPETVRLSELEGGAGWMIMVKWMWRVLDGEEKIQLERVRESFNVPGKVLNEIPALDRFAGAAKRM